MLESTNVSSSVEEVIRNYHPIGKIRAFGDMYVVERTGYKDRVFLPCESVNLHNATLLKLSLIKREGRIPVLMLPIKNFDISENSPEAEVVSRCSKLNIDILSSYERVGYIIEPNFSE